MIDPIPAQLPPPKIPPSRAPAPAADRSVFDALPAAASRFDRTLHVDLFVGLRIEFVRILWQERGVELSESVHNWTLRRVDRRQDDVWAWTSRTREGLREGLIAFPGAAPPAAV